MKHLKIVLLLGAFCASLSITKAQETPPEVQRGNSAFTYTYDYLNVKKRIGIPAGNLETLQGTPGLPAYLYFRNDLKTLRVYHPVSKTWVDAVPTIDTLNLVHKTGSEMITGNKSFNGDTQFSGTNPVQFNNSAMYPYGSTLNFRTADNINASIHTPGAGGLLWLTVRDAIFSFGDDGSLRTWNDNRKFLKEQDNAVLNKLSLVSPDTSTADFTILTRDNATGDIRQISLADLKALLQPSEN